MTQFMQVTLSNHKSIESALKNLEVQVGQLAKQIVDKSSNSFVANTEQNPKEECKDVMTRSKRFVECMSGAPAEIVSRLAARGVRHIYVDGGITIQRFLAAGLIQRLIITRIPVLLGSGIPLFGPIQRDIVLQHIGTRQYASGMVQSE